MGGDNTTSLRGEIAAAARRSNAEGALYGLAVGDALGTTLEFETLDAPRFPRLAAGPHVAITGGGPFSVAAGQVTDDTQMACALFDSILEHGAFDDADVAARYVAWTKVAFDIGGQTSAALQCIAAGDEPARAGRQVWEQRGRNAAGNGSLMRTAPIGVLFPADDARRCAASIADSAVTHFDPRCQIACAGFNGAIAAAVRGEATSVGVMFDWARAGMAAAESELLRVWPDMGAEVAQAVADLEADLAGAERDDPELYGQVLHLHTMQGYVRVGFRLAFWELAHAPSFERGLVDVVNRGGDADTNGAIAGALLGAYFGVEGIPAPWLEPVLAVQVGGSAEHPLNTRYHPRRFRDGLAAIFGDAGL